MKIVAMYVGDYKPVEYMKMFQELVDQLGINGVEVITYSESRMVFTTSKVYVTFVTDLKQMEGRLFDEIFGNLPEKFIIGRLRDWKFGRFKGTILDYIIKEEGIV
jgi:hypothetical protein